VAGKLGSVNGWRTPEPQQEERIFSGDFSRFTRRWRAVVRPGSVFFARARAWTVLSGKTVTAGDFGGQNDGMMASARRHGCSCSAA
jgi:hypothetical protein